MLRIAAGLLALLISSTAFGQSTVLQGGGWTAGRAPMYVGAGSGQAVVQDSGPAGGGATGLGLKELLLTARGTGTPPFVAQGTGPGGTNFCNYDAPTSNATGYHYICMSPNATVAGVTGSIITAGAGGATSNVPLYLCSNGTCVTPSGTIAGLSVGTTTISGGTSLGMLYNNAGVLGNTNSLANALLVTNGSGTPSFSTSIPSSVVIPLTVGTTTIASGTDQAFLYDNAGILGNLAPVSAANAMFASGQTIGVPPELLGAVQDGSTNVTRYFADTANYIAGLTGRRAMALYSGAGYLVTPLQFGGSNPTSGTAVGEIGPASTTITITGNPTVPITIGQSVTGAGVTAGTIVTGFGAKTNGGVGTYTVNNSQTVAAGTTLTFTAPSITASISGTTMTVTAVANGQLNLVDSLVGTGIIAGTTIVAQTSGSTGLAGTYTVSYSQTVAATTVRAYPYTVVPIPNGIVGAPGGETATLLKGWGSNATPNSVIKIVDPPALGAVLGFEVGNFRVDGNSLYGSPLSFHGFSTTTAGGVPWAHDISVLNGTRDTCGVYVLGNAPAAISWGAIEAMMTNISSTTNAVCGFRFDGNSGTGNYNIQSIQLNGLKANGNITGNGIEFDYTNFVCIACLGQSNGGVGFAFDHVNTGQIIGGYTEGNSSGASTGTANTARLDITGQFLEGVNATLQACGSCSIKIKITAGTGEFRNDGNVTTVSAVATSPTAGQGILGASAGAGLQLFGRGSTYDATLYNYTGTAACGVLTGTQQLDCNAFSIGTKTLSVAGNWAMSGAFTFTGTLTGNTAVTFPTSGTLATTAGASIPTIAQGDLLYGSAANTLSALAKDTGTTRYLSNTGSSNNPAWAQVALSTGISGFGANVATWLGTPSSANLRAAVTDESGTGALLFADGNIGAATGTSLVLGTCTIGSNLLCVGGTSVLAGNTTISSTAATATPDALLVVNGNTAATVALAITPQVHIVGPDAANAGISINSYGDKVRIAALQANGTQGAKTATSTASDIFSFNGYGWNTSAYAVGGSFAILPTETWSATAQGTAIRFLTTPSTTTTLTEAVRIHSSGGVSVGTTTDPGIGTISANVKFTAAGSAGLSVTKTVRASGGAADCTLIYTGGILTGGTC